MQHTHQLEAIREVVTQTFAEYAPEEMEVSETVLIRNGFYCGRCFRGEAVRAVWFAEENVVKFYGEEGQFLDTRCVDDGVEHQQRRAA